MALYAMKYIRHILYLKIKTHIIRWIKSLKHSPWNNITDADSDKTGVDWELYLKPDSESEPDSIFSDALQVSGV